MQIYIVSKANQKTLIDNLLKESGKTYLIDTQIKSLAAFIKTELEEPNLFDVYHAIKDLDLKRYAALYHDVGFLDELYQMKNQIDAFSLDIDNLAIDDELKTLLKTMPGFTYQKLYASFAKRDFSSVTIVDANYDIIDQKVIAIMLKNGAKLYHSNDKEHHDFQDTKVSERQSIEAMIQYISKQNLALSDVGIITLKANQKLLRATLMRYAMPHYYLRDERINPYSLKLIALIDFYQNKSTDNYLEVVNNNIYAFSNTNLNTYLKKHFAENDELFKGLKRFENEQPYYRHLEASANALHAKIYPKLAKLCNCDSFMAAIKQAFLDISDNSKDCLKLKSFLESNAKNLTSENWFILKAQLQTIPSSSTANNGIVIGGLMDGIKRKYLFVLNASQDCLPGFKGLNGLLSEKTIENTAYPKLSDRYNFHLKRLDYLNESVQTIYLYNSSDYEGKTVEKASMIENFPDINLVLIETDGYYHFNHSLFENLAKEYFFQDQILTTSVSALEKYMQCHYAYFLNYLLGLYEPRTFELNPATIGTIIHAAFETLIKEHGKHYFDISKAEAEALFEADFKRLDLLFPNNQKNHQLFKTLIADAFYLEIEYLKLLEAETDFKPKEVEYPFKTMMIDTDDAKVMLKGVIDRIDYGDRYFRIIDYKTSTHSLNKDKLSKGLQLQLLSYLLIYEKISKRLGMGAYYLNVNHPLFKFDDYTYSIKDGLKPIEKDEAAKFKNEHRLKGLALYDYAGLDYEFNFVLNRGKKQISKDYRLDPSELKTALNTIYSEIYQMMANGDISLNPTKDACAYCKYQEICHFKGDTYFERSPLYTFEKEDGDETK